MDSLMMMDNWKAVQEFHEQCFENLFADKKLKGAHGQQCSGKEQEIEEKFTEMAVRSDIKIQCDEEVWGIREMLLQMKA